MDEWVLISIKNELIHGALMCVMVSWSENEY